MKRGQLVKVFQKPLTREDYEGQGKIVSIYPSGYDAETKLHLVRVKFTPEESPVVRRVFASDVVE